jgi:uncharacterized protein
MCLLLALLLASGTGAGIRAQYQKYEFRIPMRDGVHLFTAVYVPKDRQQKYPILLTRTPYSVAPYGPDAYPEHLGPSQNFADDKFIFVYQDVRGRYMSEGEWVEMRPETGNTDESTDTYDTIEWLLKNVPNNNGKVGLWGVSYPGFYASAGMINAHPALVAVSPQAPVSDLYMGDDAYHNGAFFLAANFDFYVDYFNKQKNPTLPEKEKKFDFGTKDGYQFFLHMGSVGNSNKLYFKNSNPYWTDVIEHTNYDSFWQARDILPHLRNIKPAVLVVGGWFDAEDLSGTFKTYRAIQSQSPGTLENFVMGPWCHGCWQGKGDKLGDISFGSDTGEFFRDQIELPFFRYYLKNAPDPGLPKAYVFETGKNIWRRQDDWPPADSHPKRLYFESQGQLGTNPPTEKTGFDEYISDPANPVPFFDKPTVTVARPYMDADQRFVEHRPDVVTYRTEPLSGDVTVAGPVSSTLFVSTTGTDSDFVVKLIDVYPDGYEQLVRGEPFRGKFRNSFEQPEPFKPGEIQSIHMTMPDIYHCFQKGHRVMVEVQSSWFPLTDRNPQSFTFIPDANPAQYVKATERIYRSEGTASFLEVNVEGKTALWP